MFVDEKDQPQHKATILCPLCGLKFTPDSSNICPACTIASIESENILKAGEEQLICSYCQRYERPPWVNCNRQSPQLLAILLKKIKGLGKSQIKQAKFIWTEPHSKRIRIKIDFIRNINQNTKVLQTQIVQFTEKYTQCNDCKKQFTPHEWNTLIQIRQHASHKRTLLTLEQNLTRQKWLDKALKIETVEGGMDLHFRSEQDAGGCLTYIKSHLPVTYKVSSQLISANEKDNTCNVKTTHALIIPSICKDDLLLMHPKFCKQFGNCSPLLLCLKVTSQMYFLDPTTNRRIVITPTQFIGLEPYSDIYNFTHFGKTFTVLDNQGPRNEESHNTVGTWGLVVTLSDEMIQQFVRSHMNCEVGQQMQGYSLQEWTYIKNLPKYLLVKRIKTEDEKEKKKSNKNKKRKEEREQKKKIKESKQISQIGKEEKQMEPEADEKQVLEDEKQVLGDEDWIDFEDEDEL